MKSREIKRYYIVQYSITIVCFILVLLLENTPTRVSQFFEGDLTISHTCGNTVRQLLCLIVMNSTVMVFIYYVVVALVILLFVCIFVNPSQKLHVRVFSSLRRKLSYNFIEQVAHYYMFQFARVAGFTLLIGNVLKNIVGKPRPCFFDMCQYPRADPSSFVYGEYGKLGNITKCTAPV